MLWGARTMSPAGQRSTNPPQRSGYSSPIVRAMPQIGPWATSTGPGWTAWPPRVTNHTLCGVPDRALARYLQRNRVAQREAIGKW